MHRIKVFIIALIFLNCFRSELTFCQEPERDKKSLLNFNASYIGDVVTNFSGGIKKGTRYLGLANFRLGLSTESIGLWKGGEFFINGANAHGGDPSAELVGDFHVISNIETDDLTYLHELWFKQVIGNLEISLGLQDLNTEFVSTAFGGIFLNSTFGTPSTIASNIPSPIFPLTAVGVSVKLNIAEQHALKLAFFDGLPTSFTENPHNLRWTIDEEEGIFAITEYSLSGKISGFDGAYRAGIYYHSQTPVSENEEPPGGIEKYNSGFYLIADQELWKDADGTGQLGFFGQLAISPERINTHHLYTSAGLTYKGIFNSRPGDEAGLAFNRTQIRDKSYGNECVIEFTYKAQVFENMFIQPDLQFVLNPGGSGQGLNNAFAGLLRFGLIF